MSATLANKIADAANALAAGVKNMGTLATLGLSSTDVRHMQLLGLPVMAHCGHLLAAYVPPLKGFTRAGNSVRVHARFGMNYVTDRGVEIPVRDVLIEEEGPP